MGFIYVWIVLAVLGWFIFKTNSGRYLLKRYCPWTEVLVWRVLWVVAVLAFVIDNPVSHAIIAGVGLITYWILSKGSFWSGTDQSPYNHSENPRQSEYRCKILCKPIGDDVEISASRNNLQRSLYSSPYINHDYQPKIFFNGNEYIVELVMTSDLYISSLKHFLLQAGFNINIINK